MPSHTKKTIFILALLLFTGVATAATIEPVPEGDKTVWNNADYDQPELTATCSKGTIKDVYIPEYNDGQKEVLIDSSEENKLNITTSDFSNLRNQADTTVKLECSDGSTSKDDEVVVDLAELSIGVENEAVGFVGEIMKSKSGSLGNREGLELNVNIEGSDYSKSDLRKQDFRFPEYLDMEDGEFENDKGELILRPYVNSFSEYPVKLNVTAKNIDGFSKIFDLESEEDLFIHEWKADRVEHPGRDIEYEDVESGDYEYFLDMQYRDRNELPESGLLDSQNFVVTVERQNDDGDYEDVTTADVKGEKYDSAAYNEMEIMRQEDPGSNSEANYRVAVADYSRLDALEAGKYRFTLSVKYDADRPELNDRVFHVDQTRVDKSSEFSGVILNADGNGVKTLMELRSGDTTKNVESESDGYFSTEIEESSYNLETEFYDTTDDTSTSPDAQVSLDEVALDNADLGPGGSAINFHYWENPEADIEGLKPVNMMATKFGYPIDGGISELRMSFDSGDLNPDDMKVYQCGEWNFDGENCMSSWNEISRDNFEVNYATWEAIIDGSAVNEYDAEGDDILMGAYVIGTSSDIQLQESISVESTDLTYNSELGVSGVLVDESGDRVEDSDVTLSLKDTDYSWNTTTDSTGTFRFDNKVDADPGNYVLQLDAEKAPYNSLSIESDATLTVSYEKGIETEAPTDQEISQGETTEISFDVTNTGQTDVEDIEVSPSGVKDQFIRNVDAPSSIESGKTEQVTISLNLPDDYCSDTCYRELNADVEGVAGEETVSASVLLTTTLQVEQQQNQNNDSSSDGSEGEQNNNQDENTTDEQSSQQPENETNGITGAFSEAQRMTGEFVEQQSDLNIALGLIMIFTLILAAAVKKKKDQGGDGRGGRMDDRSRPNIAGGTSSADSRVQRPDVSSKQRDKQEAVSEERSEPREQEETESESTEEPAEPEDEEVDEEGASEDFEETDEEVPDDVCDICGEEFESATGVKIHKQAVH